MLPHAGKPHVFTHFTFSLRETGCELDIVLFTYLCDANVCGEHGHGPIIVRKRAACVFLHYALPVRTLHIYGERIGPNKVKTKIGRICN